MLKYAMTLVALVLGIGLYFTSTIPPPNTLACSPNCDVADPPDLRIACNPRCDFTGSDTLFANDLVRDGPSQTVLTANEENQLATRDELQIVYATI